VAKLFKDARLKRLIELSLENNRDLRVAALNIDATRAKLQVARADQLPTVNAGINGSRGPAASGAITSSYTAGLSVTAYELDFFGRVRALSQAAQSQLLATEEARKTVQISLIASVANTYLTLLADDELLRITRETLKTRQESLRLMQLKYDNEAASKLDLSTAQSLLEAAKVSLAQQTRQRATDESALVLLVGQPLPADLPAGLGLAEQGFLSDLPAGVPSELLVRRPDVRQAEQNLLALNANIGAARAAFFPRDHAHGQRRQWPATTWTPCSATAPAPGPSCPVAHAHLRCRPQQGQPGSCQGEQGHRHRPVRKSHSDRLQGSGRCVGRPRHLGRATASPDRAARRHPDHHATDRPALQSRSGQLV